MSNVDFDLMPCEIPAVTGDDGAGKLITVKSICDAVTRYNNLGKNSYVFSLW